MGREGGEGRRQRSTRDRFDRGLVEFDGDDRRGRRRPLVARWWFWVLVAVVLQVVPWPAAWADEIYLGITLPAWSALTTALTAVSGRSLSALLLLALLTVTGVAILASRRTRRAAWRGLGGVVASLAISFPFVFGLGYHTTRLEERLAALAQSQAADSDDARERVRQLVVTALVAAQAEAAPNTTAGGETTAAAGDPVIAASTALAVAPTSLAAAAAGCLADYLPNIVRGPLASVPQRVKAVPRGWLLRIGFSGVVSPWLLEPHIDPALPGPAGLAVAMHELAHTAGFAREAEAEAVALLAGLACEHDQVRYASALKAATAFANELPAGARERYLESWPASALSDAMTASAIARNYRSRAAAEVATRVYDTYLSSQGSGGMSDYGRATDLLVQALGGPSELPGPAASR